MNRGNQQPEEYGATKDGDEAREGLFADCLALQRKKTHIKMKC